MDKDMRQGQSLAVGQAMLLDDHILADGLFATRPDLGNLGAQAIDKELQPTCHVHAGFSYALDSLVKSGEIPVVVFADCEQPLKVVPRPVKVQSG